MTKTIEFLASMEAGETTRIKLLVPGDGDQIAVFEVRYASVHHEIVDIIHGVESVESEFRGGGLPASMFRDRAWRFGPMRAGEAFTVVARDTRATGEEQSRPPGPSPLFSATVVFVPATEMGLAASRPQETTTITDAELARLARAKRCPCVHCATLLVETPVAGTPTYDCQACGWCWIVGQQAPWSEDCPTHGRFAAQPLGIVAARPPTTATPCPRCGADSEGFRVDGLDACRGCWCAHRYLRPPPPAHAVPMTRRIAARVDSVVALRDRVDLPPTLKDVVVDCLHTIRAGGPFSTIDHAPPPLLKQPDLCGRCGTVGCMCPRWHL